MQFILAHKKAILTAIAALFAAVSAILYVVPGDQKEAAIQGVGAKVGEIAKGLPEDAAK